MYDEDIENNGLRELIEKGREQGFITYADINDFLPDDVSDPDQLDEVFLRSAILASIYGC